MAMLKLFATTTPAWLIALRQYRRQHLAIDIKPTVIFFDKFRALMELPPIWLAMDCYKFYVAAGVVLAALTSADYGKRFPHCGLDAFDQVNAFIKFTF